MEQSPLRAGISLSITEWSASGSGPHQLPLSQANKFSLGLSWRWQEDRAGCFVWALYDFSPPFLSLKRNVIIRAFVVSTGGSERRKKKKKNPQTWCNGACRRSSEGVGGGSAEPGGEELRG